MKALSLWQPWATLIAIGAKHIETRSWAAPRALVGQRIAIHAGLNTREMDRCAEEPFLGALVRAGYHYPLGRPLPFGAVVATALLDGCERITLEVQLSAGYPERVFGDYAIGRFAWLLRDVRPVGPPVPCRGRQRVFDLPLGLLVNRP